MSWLGEAEGLSAPLLDVSLPLNIGFSYSTRAHRGASVGHWTTGYGGGRVSRLPDPFPSLGPLRPWSAATLVLPQSPRARQPSPHIGPHRTSARPDQEAPWRICRLFGQKDRKSTRLNS